MAERCILMATAREVLSKLWWSPNHCIHDVEIWYIHRGAPNDIKIITGREITRLHKSFMEVRNTLIPYHRIVKIVKDGETLFKRRKSA